MKTLLLALLVLAGQAEAAIALDGPVPTRVFNQAGAFTSASLTHTSGIGTDRLLLVRATSGYCPSASNTWTAYFAGVTLTAYSTNSYSSGGCQIKVATFTGVFPVGTAGTIYVNFPASGGGGFTVYNLSGVRPFSPLIQAVGNAGSPSSSLATSITNNNASNANFLIGYISSGTATLDAALTPMSTGTPLYSGYTFMAGSGGKTYTTTAGGATLYAQEVLEVAASSTNSNRSLYLDLFIYPDLSRLKQRAADFLAALTFPSKLDAHTQNQVYEARKNEARFVAWERQTNRLRPTATPSPVRGTPTRTPPPGIPTPTATRTQSR